MVNATKVAIYNKTGTLVTPAFDLSLLWATTPTDHCAKAPCARSTVRPNHQERSASRTSQPRGAKMSALPA